MKHYKWTAPGGQAPFANDYRYPLPVKNADGTWTPGEWTEPAQGDLKPRTNGYHVCRPKDLINWINAELYEVEVAGDQAACNDPGDSILCVRRVRLTRRVENWNERTARLFAAWCARQALALMPEPDPRSVAAISTAERFAYGRATAEELDAARAAAWDVAWDEARAAQGAAREADWYVAGAAWAAASAAARDAVRAARDAARDAAWTASWAAARVSARGARATARGAQTTKLLELLEMIEEERHD